MNSTIKFFIENLRAWTSGPSGEAIETLIAPLEKFRENPSAIISRAGFASRAGCSISAANNAQGWAYDFQQWHQQFSRHYNYQQPAPKAD